MALMVCITSVAHKEMCSIHPNAHLPVTMHTQCAHVLYNVIIVGNGYGMSVCVCIGLVYSAD